MENSAGETFGEWLSVQLSRRGWSARYFAEKIGVRGQSVTKWINGGHADRKRIPAIAAELGLHEDEVWKAYQESAPPPYTDVTLTRLLDLPRDLRRDEVILLRHLFRAMRAAEDEIEGGRRLSDG